MNDKKWLSFKEKLNANYQFPTLYPLTCVVQKQFKQEVFELIKAYPILEVKEKSSSNEKYISLTFKIHVINADEIIAAYQSIAHIKNILFI